ncbi:unnamed protein product [Microthlaspi erraticum]|uniref:Uncharacterized protein n=1 Tax=Microthlaspi erraticum TaxID=1685480 RepID=A0A6D2JNN6_9BRAS|nr:unnamed protein product [Microthlaspi erraticum]
MCPEGSRSIWKGNPIDSCLACLYTYSVFSMLTFRNRGGDAHSRRREDISRGKRHVKSDDDFEEDETMEDAPFPEPTRDDVPLTRRRTQR